MDVEVNGDIVVMDAEDSGSNGQTTYDLNEQLTRVYEWQLREDLDGPLVLPAMSKQHRRVIHEQSKKLGLVYESAQGDEEPKVVTIKKKPGHVAKVWGSPFSPSKDKQRQYDKLPVGASEVIDGFLWLGSGRDADDVVQLSSLGVNHVLNVTEEWKEHPKFREHNIVFKRIQIKDFVTESMQKHFTPAFEYLDYVKGSGGRVLVHCVVGKSRSATVVLAYLMTRHGMTLRQSFDHVRRTRDFIRPNDAFVMELLKLEADLYGGCNTLALEDLPAMKMAFSAQPIVDKERIAEFVRSVLTDEAMDKLCSVVEGNKRGKRPLTHKGFMEAAVALVATQAKQQKMAKKSCVNEAHKVAQQYWDKHDY